MVDVVIIVGASSPKTFLKQKEAILEIARQHQNTNLDYIYEVIQHGKTPLVKKSLKQGMNSQGLESFVESLVFKESGEVLPDAIRQAKLSFEQHGRPKAKKVLVVFSDESNLNVPVKVLQESGEKLRGESIKIIGVSVDDEQGNLDDKLEGLTGKKPLKIDQVNNDNTPEKTGEKIAEQTVTGQ